MVHVGIILDGNRRYAKKEGIPQLEGHRRGAENVVKLVQKWAGESDVDELTLYTFSMQNFKRSTAEVAYLMNLFVKFFRKIKKIITKKVRIHFIGRLHKFPKKVQDVMHDLMEKTKMHKGLKVNFAMGYGGREEIVDGVKKLVSDVEKGMVDTKDITQEKLNEYMYLKNEPDLIIRTGGDHRTSNFLLWQSWYSEWFFVAKYWPEFELVDLQNIVRSFTTRDRRYGV